MQMPGRRFNAGGAHRYGFNGQEKSLEVNSEGNLYTAEFWEYDSRTSRRWNVDPEYAIQTSESPFAVFGNNPILYKDPDGRIKVTGTKEEKRELTRIITNVRDKIKQWQKQKDSKELKAMLATTGFTNVKALLNHLKINDKGPTVRFGNFAESSGSGAQLISGSGNGNGGFQAGSAYAFADSREIVLDKGIFTLLSQRQESMSSGSPVGSFVANTDGYTVNNNTEYSKAMVFASRVFEHELTHNGASINRPANGTPGVMSFNIFVPLFGVFPFQMERGNFYERAAYGEIISHTSRSAGLAVAQYHGNESHNNSTSNPTRAAAQQRQSARQYLQSMSYPFFPRSSRTGGRN